MNQNKVRNLKVAFVIPNHWDSELGGAELQAKYLLETLAKRKHVEVFYLASKVATASNPTNYRLIQIQRRNILHRYGLFWDAFALLKKLDKIQPDVIYQRVAGAYTGICAYYARRNNIPLIWHVANSPDCDLAKLSHASVRRPHYYLDKVLSNFGSRNAHRIITQNHDQVALIKANFERTDTTLIPNFHPFPDIRLEKPISPLHVVWIANLKDAKRPQEFINLASLLSGVPNIRFSMIGSPYPPQQAAKQQQLMRRVSEISNLEYLGTQTITRVNDILETAHLLINTSVFEGFSNTFIQAWQRQVPVLTLGVNPDGTLDGGPLGTSCDNVEMLSQKVLDFAGNPEKLIQNGVAARHFAQRNFSMANAEKLAGIILEEC